MSHVTLHNLRGARVLNSLKGFESTGKPMLPILQAVPATLPFFIVVLCWFSGASARLALCHTNLQYVPSDFHDSFFSSLGNCFWSVVSA